MHVSFQISGGFFCLFVSDIYPGVELLGHSFIFSFLRNLHTVFHSGWKRQFTFQPTVYKVSCFSTSSPFLICVVFDDGHSDKCEAKAAELTFRSPTGLGETKTSLLKDAHEISHAWRPRAKAEI